MMLTTVGGSAMRAGPRAWRHSAGLVHRRRAIALVPSVLAAMGEPATHWVAGPPMISSTRTAVVPLGPAGMAPVAMAKIPGTAGAAAAQRREGRVLTALAAERSLGDFTSLLPVRLTDGSVGGQAFVVERALPGVPAETAGPSAAIGAATAIADLHRRTTHSAVVDAAILRRWVDDRVELLTRATRRHATVDRLRGHLRRSWAGRRVDVCWVHGDFWLGNVMVDARTGATAGIVDWEWAEADELPAQDVVYACLHARMRAGGGELGDVVAGLLADPTWNTSERELHVAALQRAESTVPSELLLLVWLRQIAANLTQEPRLARNPVWVRRNVASVLRAIDATPAGRAIV
jgi:Phosphotransferase enzyme family